MSKRAVIIFSGALLALALPALIVLGQTAPDSINSALADLGSRVGRTVALADLTSWSFEQQLFPDTSLGCPQPGMAYAQVQTSGVRFLLTYQGTTYDYRVSADRTLVVLCASAPAPTPDPRQSCPPANDPAYLPARLTLGGQGRVVPGGFPNNVREQPGTSSAKIGEIPPGSLFTVLDGPRCSTLDQIVWWQVNFNGLVGWTPEGQAGVYWLEPVNAQGTPLVLATPTPRVQPLPLIDLSNASQVGQLLNLDASSAVVAQLLFRRWLAVGQADGLVVLLDPQTGTQAASFPAHTGAVTSLAEGIDSAASRYFLATGGADGVIRIWELQEASAPAQRGQLIGHTGAVTSLTFDRSTRLIISGGADNSVRLWDAQTGAQLALLTGHDAPIVHVQLSPDGARILSLDSAGGVRLWGIGAGPAG